ncbi:MAG: acetyl-CoA carboxylase biotin carboxyl carrier protein [Candidatus Acididesulfobacter guangdongensis]|uniref:Biotin carboxyl carrier protein of acetyl-CoA carboxylase n=1 Tax=Acididesulfobacter guangdongensis TaxID=2597225 RepID=A0A519BEJ1_ACIG2|nr:MAG: acetyl-CoA carboxylase biotin carboxyl carrier protein [Candidatus Acididesulfobacter guangdongensis]
MNIKDIKDLVKFIKSNKVGEFYYKKGDEEIKIKLDEELDFQDCKTIKNNNRQERILDKFAEQISEAEASALSNISKGESLVQDIKKIAEFKEDTSRYKEIVSPFVGAFYRASAPDKPPFVEIDSIVEKNSPVCIIEAMKLMNEIEADIKCRIVSILAENGQVVEYGQPLFIVEPV